MEILIRDSDKPFYEKLYASANDLNLARFYASTILKKGWHSKPFERRGTVYLQQSAFTTAMIVAYARPFTQSRGWPDLSKRVVELSEDELNIHSSVLSQRNQVYAHSDSCRYEFRPFALGSGVTNIRSEPFLRMSKVDVESLLAIIDKHLSWIRGEIRTILEANGLQPVWIDI